MSAETVPIDQEEKRPRPHKQGTSDLAKSEERLAYILLVPTLIVLFLIAFYPLGSVFYNSLTDKEFASAREAQFVGLDNFAELLGVTIAEVPAKVDEETGEIVRDPDTGEIDYEPAVSVLPREPRRYRELTEFTLFGTRYVLGATDPEFLRAIFDTVAFSVITVALETILGLGIALVVNSEFRGRGGMRVVMLVPWAIPTAVSSRMWEWMFKDTRAGFFNLLFQQLGLGNGQIPFLVDQSWQLPAMIAIDVWKTTPFMALLLLAGLQLIPGELYEAADVDGAGRLRQFWSVTLPLLRPTLAVALVFRTLDAIRVFDVFQIVLQKKRYSMASYAYYELIDGQKMGYSSAASVVIFFVIFVFAVIYIRMLGVSNE